MIFVPAIPAFPAEDNVSYLVHCVKPITQYAHVYASDSEHTPTFGICSAFHLKKLGALFKGSQIKLDNTFAK